MSKTGRPAKQYEPTKQDEQFLLIAKKFGFICTCSIPTLSEIQRQTGITHFNTLKKWQYLIGSMPRALPYGDATQQSAIDHMRAVAQDFLKADKSYMTPMSPDSDYLAKPGEERKPKFVPDPLRDTPIDGVIDYDADFSEDDFKNIVFTDGKD